MVTHLYNLLIKDAEDTIRHVCKAVLENPETDVDQRKQMAEGILHIARAFQVAPVTRSAVKHRRSVSDIVAPYLLRLAHVRV